MLRLPHGTVEPRRVFCIGRNYGDHISEMGAALDDSCIIFMKPATCLVPAGATVALPRDRGVVHHELEMVAAIGAAGKNIGRLYLDDHYAAVWRPECKKQARKNGLCAWRVSRHSPGGRECPARTWRHNYARYASITGTLQRSALITGEHAESLPYQGGH